MRNVLRKSISSPKRVLLWSLFFLILSAAVAPSALMHLLKDGNFNRYGWNIDLSTWPRIVANSSGQPDVGVNIKSNENGLAHKLFWLNSGQYLVFVKVPASSSTRFRVQACVHPDWNKGMTLEPLIFRVVVTEENNRQTVVEKTIMGNRDTTTLWQDFDIDLAPYAKQKLDIKIMSAAVSQRTGIWTLWRDPEIVVAR